MKRSNNLIPDFLKPAARQIYLPLFRVRLWWRTKVTDRESRHELHRYWRSPYDGCNGPESYMEGQERSRFLADLVKTYVTIEQEPVSVGGLWLESLENLQQMSLDAC